MNLEHRRYSPGRVKRILFGITVFRVLGLAVLGASADSGKDKWSLKVPGGLAFSEFKGYETWQLVSISEHVGKVAAILANPTMIKAYQAGAQHDVDFMMKDSSGSRTAAGGVGPRSNDAASDKFRAADATDKPRQEHDGKCGFACRTNVKNRDYVFAERYRLYPSDGSCSCSCSCTCT